MNNCPNCGSDTYHTISYTRRKDETGVMGTFVYCDMCPREEVQREMPLFFVKGGGQEVVKQLDPTKIKDWEDRVKRDINNKTFTVGNSGGMEGWRENKIDRHFKSQFGGKPYDILHDDGATVIARPKDAPSIVPVKREAA